MNYICLFRSRVIERPDSGSDMDLRGPHPHGPHGGGSHEEAMFERQQRNFYMDLRVSGYSYKNEAFL